METRFGIRAGQHVLDTKVTPDRQGLGWAIGIRPCQMPLEFELSTVYYGEGDDVFGVDAPIQASFMWYISPEQGFSPFAEAGMSFAKNNRDDRPFLDTDDDMVMGLHFGLGIQYKQNNVSARIEGRHLAYDGLSDSRQIQALAGIDVHF